MKTKKSKSNLIKSQSGIASMVVVILIMSLLTLVVIAMTRNSNREQQQALDRQLSTQAFYAAESGVNDTKDYIVNSPPGEPRPNKKEDCNGLGTANDTGNQFPSKVAQVGIFENTKYTCVLYDRIPTELRYFPIDVKTPTITPIEDIGGVPISSLTFTWNQAGGGNNFDGCALGPGIPKKIPDNCQSGLLRIELIDPASTTRQQLIDSAFVLYVKPSNSGSSTFSYGDASGSPHKQGAVTTTKCDTGGSCSITITSIEKDKLFLNQRSIYKLNDVKIVGHKVAGGEVRFRDAQMKVDSTGQAGGLLRRVQVMVDLTGLNSGFIPPFVLQTSSDLCKRLEIQRDHTIINGCPT